MAKKENIVQLSKEPIEIELSGKKWKLSPPTVGDLVSFESYIRNRKLKTFLDNSKDAGLTSEERSSIISGILNETEVDESGGQLTSLEGVTFLLWRCLQRNHNELELEEVGNLIKFDDVEQLGNLLATMMFGKDAKQEGDVKKVS